MRSQIVLFVALAVSLFNGVQSFAQSKGPPEPNPDRTPLPPIDGMMPIDNSLYILLIAGLILGSYYAYNTHTNKKKAV